MLGQLGARVIKVEPLGGDWIRGTGASQQGMSANALSGNFNKRGVAIDAEGADIPIRTLRNISLNPNFGGEVMVVSLGCEKLQPERLLPPGSIAVNAEGYREILGIVEGAKEDKAGWSGFLKHLKQRGLKGVRLII